MGTPNIIMLGLIVIVFYFFMIRPQVKKQKDQKNYVNDLKKGDKVILLIEDDLKFIKILTGELSRSGFKTIVSYRGAAAGF